MLNLIILQGESQQLSSQSQISFPVRATFFLLFLFLMDVGVLLKGEGLIWSNLYLFLMFQTRLLLIALLGVLMMAGVSSASPVDITIEREYYGEYTSRQSGKNFDYLEEHSGQIIAIFYGSPNREVVNSVEIVLLDPKYEDERVMLLDVKGIVEVDPVTGIWVNPSHSLTYTKIWREREGDLQQTDAVNSRVTFENLDSEDYEEVTITIQMTGNNFQFTAELRFYNQILSTMAYSLYMSVVTAIQIYSAYVLLKVMDAPNFVFSAKFSLLTLSLCNIEDFSQTMTHIQYIMGSGSGYLFFILPALSLIVLFIIFDMKMLFLVWKSHNLANMENPQLLRKRLTSFYIQFYLGLFLYLTLTYFFAYDPWMILLRNLLLLPQIVHNVRLGQKPNFNPYYIFGFIGSRLLIPLYERACPENRFKLAPNPTLFLILLSIFLLQVILIGLQNRLGSRFFVPKRFLPNYFEYRTKIRTTESNAHEDCAICLQGLVDHHGSSSATRSSDSNRLRINEDSVAEELKEELLDEEVMVMRTPCNHNFHEQCLTQWLDVKLECPTCRAVCPPL